MARVRQQFLKPGFYGDSTSGLRELTADDLRRYRDDTNKAIKSGLAIPFIDDHCDPIALDTQDAESVRTRGWLEQLQQNKDGSLSYVADITDADCHRKIKDKSIKLVSPQLNPYFEKNGTSYGSIVRHMAFTPKPVNPDQGPMEVLALSETDQKQPFIVDLNQYQGAKMPKAKTSQMAEDDKKKKLNEEVDDVTDVVAEVANDENPENEIADDLPTNDTVVTEETAGADVPALLMKLIEVMGVSVPDGTDLSTDSGLALAIGVMIGSASSNAVEEEVAPMVDPIEEERPTAAQFSEPTSGEPTSGEQKLLDRISALENRNAAQSHTQRLAALNLHISGSGLPKGLRGKLKNYAASAQFSEDGTESAKMSISQVVSLIKDSIPPGILQMSETNEEEGGVAVLDDPHPEAGEFFSDKDGKSQQTQQEAAQEARGEIPKRTRALVEAETTTVDYERTGQVIKRGPGRPKQDK